MDIQLSDKVILTRMFQQKQRVVFSAFETAEAISQWLSPAPDIEIRVDTFEFQPRGQYRYVYNLPDGNEATLAGEFIRIIKPQLLSFSWEWEVPDPHAGIQSHVTVALTESHSGTELTITHTKLTGPQMADRHEAGWIGALDRLALWLTRYSTIKREKAS